MASTYIVKKNQNIYDVAVQIYGSIEGLFDLLISNEGLTVNTDLVAGQELKYHDIFIQNQSILNTLKEEGITLANGKVKEYIAVSYGNAQLVMAAVGTEGKEISIKIKGGGQITVEWGDGTYTDNNLQIVDSVTLSHTYSDTGIYRVVVFGDSNLTALDVRGTNGSVFIQKCNESLVSYSENRDNIKEGTIRLFGPQMRQMVLQNKVLFDTTCLEKLDLTYLDLTGATFEGNSIYEYMLSRKENSATLSGGEIHLSEIAVDTATIEVIYDMVNDPDYGEKWIVYVDDTVFKKDGFDYFNNFPLS